MAYKKLHLFKYSHERQNIKWNVVIKKNALWAVCSS